MTTSRVTCPRCSAAPGVPCFGDHGMHRERTALDDTQPAIDVGAVVRERDQLRAELAALRAGTSAQRAPMEMDDWLRSQLPRRT